MTMYTYTPLPDINLTQPLYRVGNELGGDLTFAQDTLIAVIGESLGVGDGSQTVFTTAFFPVRLGSVHVYVDAIEVFNFSIDLNTGVVSFDSPPNIGLAVTIDYNYTGAATFTIDATLPMTITDTGLSKFNQLINDFNRVQSITEYWTVTADTDVTGGIFNFVITVDDI